MTSIRSERAQSRLHTGKTIYRRRLSAAWRLFLRPLLAVIISIQLSACYQQGDKPGNSQGANLVTVQLSWYHSAEFVGFYVADQMGYYNEENLQVTLREGGPGIEPLSALSSSPGFAISTGDSLLRANAGGEDWIAVAAIFGMNPFAVVYMPGSDISAPIDLVGKKIGVLSKDLALPRDQQLISLLKKLNIDPASVQLVPLMDYHGIGDLTIRRVQATSGFLTSNRALNPDSIPLASIYYSDYGVPFYPNVIITDVKLVNEQPDLVQGFIRATLSGYRYALEHPEEAANLIHAYNQTADLELERASMLAQIPLIDHGGGPIGWMDSAIWQVTQDTLVEQGVIPAPLEQVFTNQFVEASP
ncbi:MAG: ABC transporter substrate-binding protein [Anaerolineales bacterium]|nr:ABC transporter substrate-binding protein [Anaerolineales bacterium]